MSRFSTILVANRGEIAVRVMRTARARGYRTVAVFSEADSAAPHVQIADVAVPIGPPPVAASYLDVGAILGAAEVAGADAIHPGYGFLSENADFARACAEAGIAFIGPPAPAIELMGNKAAAKRRMIAAGVPCVPGYEGEAQDDATLTAAAGEIGFPIMVKAAAGGGGRGMRLVEAEADLPAALDMARSEATRAFGSGELILEKAVVEPRHVEIQVFADDHGTVIHLGERDCSVQRRHQKVIEEAPCPVMTEDLRAAMGSAAVEAARSIDYRGAGTVEFLLDDDSNFYFLEMNTRLQVEHPVTEMVTGLDLVDLQIAVAEGRPLGLSQDDVAFDGHAIEARLYAEDPIQDFLPSAGHVAAWRPAVGAGVRVDGGIAGGQDVSPFYDPMVAKVIAHGLDRDTARRRLIRALEETVLFGPATNRRFLIECLAADGFAAGTATTGFIAANFPDGPSAGRAPELEDAAVAAAVQFVRARGAALDASLAVSSELTNWSNRGALVTRYAYDVGEAAFDLALAPTDANAYRVQPMGAAAADAVSLTLLSVAEGMVEAEVGGQRRRLVWHALPSGDLWLADGADAWLFTNRLAQAASAADAAGGGRVTAPMHGKLLEIAVAEGQKVRRGDRLAVLEAMKMQHEILAEVDGTVGAVHAEAGVQAAADQLLMEIDTDD